MENEETKKDPEIVYFLDLSSKKYHVITAEEIKNEANDEKHVVALDRRKLDAPIDWKLRVLPLTWPTVRMSFPICKTCYRNAIAGGHIERDAS